MTILMEQFIRLIASDTGSLTYRLVLAFSIVIAFYLAIERDAGSARVRRRMLFGLGLLLLLQIGLFVVSALAWQTMIDGRILLPPLDRAVSLISLLVLIWMWAFPEPASTADAGAIFIGLLIAGGTAAGTSAWAKLPPPQPFNGTGVDIYASAAGIALVVLGMTLLAIRRPVGFVYGLVMLAIEGAGFGFHLALLPYGDDYPSALRLAQMIAYPLLGLLPQRLLGPAPAASGLPAESAAIVPAGAGGRQESGLAPKVRLASPEIWNAIARLAGETDPDRMGREITIALADLLDADVCALMLPPRHPAPADGAGEVRSYAYDRRSRRFIESPRLDPRTLPAISSAWRLGRSRRLAASAQSPDLASVAEGLHLASVNSLLFQPGPAADNKPGPGILLISLNPDKDWDADEQEFLALLSRVLVQFLQRSQAMDALRDDLQTARQTARRSQEGFVHVQDERDRLAAQLSVLNERSTHDQEQIAQLTSIAAAHEQALAALQRLKSENDLLQHSVRQVEERSHEAQRRYEGELRLALEELALVQDALNQAEARITAYKLERVDASPDQLQFELVAAIGKELLQPLTSIGGYADMLLGDPQGALDGQQQRYIRRIKNSTERMGGLIDELLRATAPESNAGRLEFAPADVREVIRLACAAVDSQFSIRRANLRLDLPEAPLTVETDRHALQRVVEALLQNAACATPEAGDVRLGVVLEEGENKQGFALIKVADAGIGLSPDDILRVFSPAAPFEPQSPEEARAEDAATGENGRAASDAMPGLGSRPGEMARVKALVEAIGGRIWVDSRIGAGAVFTVLLPVGRAENGRTNAPDAGLQSGAGA